ncbi:alpha/beta hydrolase [Catenuloplanes sp. NPDC051500]|uniref:alpha/beta hydrolase n=1 Tax=Catenuloplanes sp. NPDC051500 TaxID=3363959 RepID=UPI00379A8B68
MGFVRGAFTVLVAAALAAVPLAVQAAAPDRSAPETVPVALADPQRFAAEKIVDVPVSFSVVNQNRSRSACNTDGRTYTVRGHLTAPQALLDGDKRSIVLYQHGIAAGEWYWRVDLPGYHHAEELAKRGHASLTIDRLGYDSSDQPDGLAMCVGGQADITHQIVRQLRAGSYTVEGRAPVTFDRVALAGQSNGGQIVQIAAYSFNDVDALIIMDWTDLGLTPQANARFFASLQTCLRGGEPVREGGPAGYAYYDLGPDEFRTGNFNDTEEQVLTVAVPHQNRHPCGDMVSQLGSVMVDVRTLAEIKIPVLMMYGEKDARVSGGDAHRKLFAGTQAELVEIPGAGHYMGLARNARMVHDAQATWLDRHDF